VSEKPYSTHSGVDYWILALLVSGIGSVSGGLNFIVTILTMRAPGLTIRRLPLFVWMMLVDSFLIITALAMLNAALVMLLADRILGAHFFQPHGGGSPILAALLRAFATRGLGILIAGARAIPRSS
jgi:cytochrome c oxidase subunit 1/cytochrome c oxidase subunit I+III